MLIQKLRLQKGWSQQQLADLSGLSVRTIQRMEQGQPGSVESLKSLASVFQIDFLALKEPNMTESLTDYRTHPSPTIPTTPGIEPHPQALHDRARELEEMLAFQQVRRLRGFYRQLGAFALVIPFLAVINLMTSPQHLWFYWPALGWGLGLLMHSLRVFTHFGPLGPEWEKREVEKRLGRPL
jgi:transcriptional regulator with XRE-family HTH domain